MKFHIHVQAGLRSGLLLIMLAATLWGTVGVLVQFLYTLADTNPLSIAFFRLVFSIPALLLACRCTVGRQMFRIAQRNLGVMLLVGGMTALSQACYFAAIAAIGVAAATLITLCTAPCWVALFASIWLRERLTVGVAVSGGCAVVGTMLLVGMEPQTSKGPSDLVQGVIFALAAAICYALVVLCSRALAGRYHPLQSLTIGFTTGSLVLLPMALLTEAGLAIHYPLAGWGSLLYLGLVTTALAYFLYFSGIRHTPATVASIAALLEPLTATLLACWFLSEQLGPLGMMGALLLLGAIALLYSVGQKG